MVDKQSCKLLQTHSGRPRCYKVSSCSGATFAGRPVVLLSHIVLLEGAGELQSSQAAGMRYQVTTKVLSKRTLNYRLLQDLDVSGSTLQQHKHHD